MVYAANPIPAGRTRLENMVHGSCQTRLGYPTHDDTGHSVTLVNSPEGHIPSDCPWWDSPRTTVLRGFRVTWFDAMGGRARPASGQVEIIGTEGKKTSLFVHHVYGRTGQPDRSTERYVRYRRRAGPQTKDRPHTASRSSMVLLHARTTISIADSNPRSYRFIASMRKGQHLRRIRHEIIITLT